MEKIVGYLLRVARIKFFKEKEMLERGGGNLNKGIRNKRGSSL